MDEAALYDARLELIDFALEVFWDVPDESFLRTLLSDEIRTPDDSVNPALDEGLERLEEFIAENRVANLETIKHRLDAEYTRLFVGPRPPVLPHETYYRDDADYMGEGLAEVQASYSAAGWSPPDDYGEEDDHVAVELAFLRHLVARQKEGADEAYGYERVFIEEHLDTWVDAFVADLVSETDEPLYLAGAKVLEGLVEFEEELAVQLS
jgi:TorA maturation chaperone TorD